MTDGSDATAKSEERPKTASETGVGDGATAERSKSKRILLACWAWTKIALRFAVVIYITLIGVFAIAELQRRERLLEVFTTRDNEIAAAIAVLGKTSSDEVAAQRDRLERERTKLHELKDRLTALIVVDAIQPTKGPPGTVKELVCEWAALRTAEMQCGAPATGAQAALSLREIGASLLLKRAAESRSSGDIFSILIIVAAVGGALIRLSLPKKDNGEPDGYHTVLRAIGGGIVCYLAISGGSLPFTGANLTMFTSPATGSMLGFLAGMFSNKVFTLLSDIVDVWVDKITPEKVRKRDSSTSNTGAELKDRDTKREVTDALRPQ